MGATHAKVSSTYVLRVAGNEGGVGRVGSPQHQPSKLPHRNSGVHAAASQKSPLSSSSATAGPAVASSSKQPSSTKLISQPSRPSLTPATSQAHLLDKFTMSKGVSNAKLDMKSNIAVVCSAKLPWLIKKAKFVNQHLTAFEFGRVIGRGLMGTVRVCKTSDDKYFVMKSIKKDYIVRHKDERHVKNEKDVLSLLTSPFCVRLFGTFQDRNNVYFALEFVPGGELFRRLGRKKSFPPTEAKFYLVEIFCALEYIQGCGVVYRDLKPENITIDEEGHCKLIDFGFSTFCSGNEKMLTICGTPAYLSPEQLDGKLTQGYTRVVDWWSFGVLLFELLTGKTPFCKNHRDSAYEIFLRILKNKVNFPMSFDKESKELISLLCHPKLEQRLTSAEEIKKHQYFADIPWGAVQERRLIPPYVPTLKDVGDAHYFERYPDVPPPQGEAERGSDLRYDFADF